MDDRVAPANPRLGILRQEVEEAVLTPFQSHGWAARTVREIDGHDCIEIAAERGAVSTRIAVLYSSSGISYSDYGTLSQRVERIFFRGQPYMFDSFAGHDIWWTVLPTHSSPFRSGPTLLLPTVGGIREYRTIAAATLYALSILARYMPSAWRRIEGGDEDQYLALVQTSLAVWERLLPEHFLESIAGESVRTAQPGSWLA